MTIDEAYTLIKSESIIENQAPTHWVDLGCGAGLFTTALSRMLQHGSHIDGIDINKTLQGRITGNGVTIRPLQLDFIRDELGLRDLDGILMANSLHYVHDKTALLQKLQPTLRPGPGASFLIVEYDTDIPVPRWVPYPLSFHALTTLFNSIGYTHIHHLGARSSAYGGNMYAAQIS